jgi:hypothetical protein
MAESFKDYSERVAQGNNALLGWLCWYSVPENLSIDHEEVFKTLVKAGLGGHVPRRPQDAEVFRRVSTAAARKKVPTKDPQVFENYLVRDMPSDNITRRIVCESVDANNKKLGYREVAELSFDRATSKVQCIHLGSGAGSGKEVRVRDEICKQIRTEYEAQRGCLNGYAIRMLILKVLKDGCNATNVRYPSGGVYFVGEDYAESLTALDKLGDALAPLGAIIHSLPLIDDKRQREMLKRAFEAESVDAIDSLLAEITDLKKSGKKITMDRYAAYVTQLNDLGAKTKEYTELLEGGLTTTQSRISIFKKAVIGLKGQVGK